MTQEVADDLTADAVADQDNASSAMRDRITDSGVEIPPFIGTEVAEAVRAAGCAGIVAVGDDERGESPRVQQRQHRQRFGPRRAHTVHDDRPGGGPSANVPCRRPPQRLGDVYRRERQAVCRGRVKAAIRRRHRAWDEQRVTGPEADDRGADAEQAGQPDEHDADRDGDSGAAARHSSASGSGVGSGVAARTTRVPESTS